MSRRNESFYKLVYPDVLVVVQYLPEFLVYCSNWLDSNILFSIYERR